VRRWLKAFYRQAGPFLLSAFRYGGVYVLSLFYADTIVRRLLVDYGFFLVCIALVIDCVRYPLFILLHNRGLVYLA
jgi:hypothetical protein